MPSVGLLFTANMKLMKDHCFLFAWYSTDNCPLIYRFMLDKDEINFSALFSFLFLLKKILYKYIFLQSLQWFDFIVSAV